MFLTEILIFLITIIISVSLWLKYYYNYWQRQNVPHIKAYPIYGNFKDLVLWRKDPISFFKTIYEGNDVVGGTSDNHPVVGLHMFHKPCLLIRDVNLVKNILVKDFHSFSNRYASSDPHSDALGAHNLFFVKNPKWKELRVKLSPVFSSGKLKQIYPLVQEVGTKLNQKLCSITENANQKSAIINVKDIHSLYSTDVIATVVYGVNANSLENPDGDFRTNGKAVFELTRKRAFEFTCMFFLPQMMRLLHLKVFSQKTTEFLRKTVIHIMKERTTSGKTRNDLIDVLVKFRKEAESDKTHFANNMDAVVAQAAIFFSAGFETSSATSSFGMYELSKRQDIQQRLRDEIREALQQSPDGQISFEQLNEMKLLHNVILEVLRMYPPLPFLDRECTATNGYSLKPYLDYTIPHGMPVYIPACSLQRDPQYFPEPDKFEPDRFSPANKPNNNQAAHMPFGMGPHNCVAERLGLIQTKIGLISFLRNHYVLPCDKSPPEMILSRYALILQSEGGIHLNLVRDPLV